MPGNGDWLIVSLSTLKIIWTLLTNSAVMHFLLMVDAAYGLVMMEILLKKTGEVTYSSSTD